MLLRPETSSIHAWVTGYEKYDHRFAGEIRVPGGIEKVQTYLFDPGDAYTVSGGTLRFPISSLVNQPLGSDSLMPRGVVILPMPVKRLVITPSSVFRLGRCRQAAPLFHTCWETVFLQTGNII
jgi:hypothetical protein